MKFVELNILFKIFNQSERILERGLVITYLSKDANFDYFVGFSVILM